MLAGEPDKDAIVENIIRELGDHSVSLAHNRHLSAAKCKEIGLKIFDLESDQKLQEKVLSIHHIYFHTLSSTPAFKIIENQNGMAFILQAQHVLMASPHMQQQAGQPPLEGPAPDGEAKEH
jgi:hypothetical protein